MPKVDKQLLSDATKPLLLTGYNKTAAQEPKKILSDKTGWHKIGETTVDFKTEIDEILVLGANRFQPIKIKITDAPINLISFVIYFENDIYQKITIGKEFKSLGESRSIVLKNGERSIKKVTFVYKTNANNMDKKAHVELWGFKSS